MGGGMDTGGVGGILRGVEYLTKKGQGGGGIVNIFRELSVAMGITSYPMP